MNPTTEASAFKAWLKAFYPKVDTLLNILILVFVSGGLICALALAALPSLTPDTLRSSLNVVSPFGMATLAGLILYVGLTFVFRVTWAGYGKPGYSVTYVEVEE